MASHLAAALPFFPRSSFSAWPSSCTASPPHPVLPAEVGTLRPGLLLAQHADDLLFRKTHTLHRLTLRRRADSKSPWMKFPGAGHRDADPRAEAAEHASPSYLFLVDNNRFQGPYHRSARGRYMTSHGDDLARLAELVALCASTLRLLSRSKSQNHEPDVALTLACDLDEIANRLRELNPNLVLIRDPAFVH